jgi:hypothetical protein
MADWDDPIAEERWCAERRRDLIDYLSGQGVQHGEVGSWPAWHVAPYVSIWAIESLRTPGDVGWWAICGDLPTDYISAAAIGRPREAMRAFAENWGEVAACMRKGVPHLHTTVGPPERWSKLAPLLECRAETLRRFTDDNSVSGADYE